MPDPVVPTPAPTPSPSPVPTPTPQPIPAPMPTAPVKPEGVPDAFWDAATGTVNHKAWGEEYRNVKSRVNDPKQTPLPANPQVPQTPQIPENSTVEDVVQMAGQNVDDLIAAFSKDGQLSSASYEAFQKLGITRAAINAELSKAVLNRSVNTRIVTQVLGGVEQYKNLDAWARSGLPAAEYEAINLKLNSNSVDVRVQGLEALKAAHLTAVNAGKTKPLLEGGTGGGGGADVFKTRAEVVQAKADPKYQSDMAYKKQVDEKLAATYRATGNIENLPLK